MKIYNPQNRKLFIYRSIYSFCMNQIKQHSKILFIKLQHNIHANTALFIPFNPTHKAFIGQTKDKLKSAGSHTESGVFYLLSYVTGQTADIMFHMSRGYHKFVIYMWMAIALPKEDKLGCSFFTVMRDGELMIKVSNNITIILLKKAMMDLQHKSMACGPVLQFG